MFRNKNAIGWVITIVGLAMSVFHLVIAWHGPPDALTLRSVHLGFALVLAFLMLPLTHKGQADTPRALEYLLIAISVVVCGYLIVEQQYIVNRMIYVDTLRPIDWVFSITTVLLVLEATRRAVGWTLPVTAVAFLVYGLTIGGADLQQMTEQMYLGTEGIFGIPLYVSATYVMLFILFGALVERTGTGQLFMDFAMSLTGHSAGGPAKVSCITSGMFGTVSGSAVANVMTTGTFTIPLMKRIGYKPAFAGAVEAVASTGGQIMPPIMGATAFIMAEFLGISYLKVAAFALLPAVLYYIAVFMTVHFEAKRTNMHGLPRSELPKLGEVLRERGHLFLPLVVIVAALLHGFSAPFAALCGVASVIPTALLRKSTRQYVHLENIVTALEVGARNTVTVALSCACAGIVIGVIFMTGLGLEFTDLVLTAAGNHMMIALVLTMFAGILLGMGMPTAPAYIMQTALLVPALVKLGVVVEAAHMFVFYFAILSAITPPVALAVYAANGISRASLWESSVAALRLGATGYIIPFMFVFGPSLLFIGSTGRIIQTAITAVVGVVCLAAGLSGYLLHRAVAWERVLLVASAVVLIKPGLTTDLIGFALIAAVIASQMATARNLRERKT
ncbi:MAG: C4-dicarboxylate ABC transporter permease [Betaproteobacteria bacterium SG8_40]|nr:MAG: C4-dicarboxylate ABC transporter permease [Betaproteobacteria bacterium SG8_40]